MAADSHDRFWKRIFGLESGIGKPGEWFVNITVVTLGLVFLVVGIFLIYRYLKK